MPKRFRLLRTVVAIIGAVALATNFLLRACDSAGSEPEEQDTTSPAGQTPAVIVATPTVLATRQQPDPTQAAASRPIPEQDKEVIVESGDGAARGVTRRS